MVAKLAPRTFRALWVGRAEGSDEHLVVNELGHVVRVRGVRRCVEMRTVVQTFSNSLRPDAGDDVELQDSDADVGRGNKHIVRCEARGYEYRPEFGRNPPSTRRRVYHEVNLEESQCQIVKLSQRLNNFRHQQVHQQ